MAERQSIFKQVADSPATGKLLSSLGDYATARVSNLGSGGSKSATEETSTENTTEETEDKPGLLSRMKTGAGKGAVGGAIKGAIKAIKPGGKKTKRPTNIIEDIWIGVPVEQCWEEWLKFEDWPGFTKGPTTVNADEEEGKDGEEQLIVSWTGKIFWSTRSFKSTVVEKVDNERLRWESEGAKGVLEGVITFTPIGDNATLVLVVIEYRGKGPIEWIGNRWRTVGRRVRLDLKHFRRHVMLLDQSDESEGDEEPEEPEEPEEQEESEPEQEESEQDETEPEPQPEEARNG